MTRIAPTRAVQPYERTVSMSEVLNLLELPTPQDDPKEKALQMYRDGVSREKIARQLRKSQSTITDWLKESGIESHRGRNVRIIQNLHDEGKTVVEIMALTGRSRSTVRAAITKPRGWSAFCYEKACTVPVDPKKWHMEKSRRVKELWRAGFDHFEIAYQVCGISSDRVLKIVEGME